jgi:hypothetical protein
VGTSLLLYFAAVAATSGTSLISGRTEKNLWRHGSQRKAGKRRTRPIIAVTPGTYSDEIRCNPWFPQIPQWA